MEVVGTASNGRLAMARMASLKPDLVTLDIEMPEMNGIEVLRGDGGRAGMKAGCHHAQLADAARRGDDGTRAGAGGIRFPDQAGGRQCGSEPRLPARPAAADDPGLRAAPGDPRDSARRDGAIRRAGLGDPREQPRPGRYAGAARRSAAGPDRRVDGRSGPHWPGWYPRCPAIWERRFSSSSTCRPCSPAAGRQPRPKSAIRVKEAEDGESAQANCAYVAPGGRHMKLAAGTNGEIVLRITDDPPENGCRPAVDYLFRSAALQFSGPLHRRDSDRDGTGRDRGVAHAEARAAASRSRRMKPAAWSSACRRRRFRRAWSISVAPLETDRPGHRPVGREGESVIPLLPEEHKGLAEYIHSLCAVRSTSRRDT